MRDWKAFWAVQMVKTSASISLVMFIKARISKYQSTIWSSPLACKNQDNAVLATDLLNLPPKRTKKPSQETIQHRWLPWDLSHLLQQVNFPQKRIDREWQLQPLCVRERLSLYLKAYFFHEVLEWSWSGIIVAGDTERHWKHQQAFFD